MRFSLRTRNQISENFNKLLYTDIEFRIVENIIYCKGVARQNIINAFN